MRLLSSRRTAKRPPAVAVVFGSGGARGLAHLGVIQALDELGLEPAIVVGTSIGAIAAAAYATGTAQQVRDDFLAMNLLQTSRMFFDLGIPRSGLTEGKHVMEKLREWIPDLDIGRLRIPFAAVAMDLATQGEAVLDTGRILDAVRASISIPGVFSPVPRDGLWLVDGGLVDPLPVSVARDKGAARVLAVDINLTAGAPPAEEKPEAPESASARAMAKLRRAVRGNAPFIVDVLVQSLRAGENAIERERLLNDAPDLLLSPPVGHIGTLDFRNPETVVRAGYDCAMAQADALRELFSAGSSRR